MDLSLPSFWSSLSFFFLWKLWLPLPAWTMYHPLPILITPPYPHLDQHLLNFPLSQFQMAIQSTSKPTPTWLGIGYTGHNASILWMIKMLKIKCSAWTISIKLFTISKRSWNDKSKWPKIHSLASPALMRCVSISTMSTISNWIDTNIVKTPIPFLELSQFPQSACLPYRVLPPPCLHDHFLISLSFLPLVTKVSKKNSSMNCWYGSLGTE